MLMKRMVSLLLPTFTLSPIGTACSLEWVVCEVLARPLAGAVLHLAGIALATFEVCCFIIALL